MNQAKIQYYEKIETADHRDFVTAQSHCALCGESLELRHKKVEELPMIKEEAYCTKCDLRARNKDYQLN